MGYNVLIAYTAVQTEPENKMASPGYVLKAGLRINLNSVKKTD
jgi:hypothetical protein